MADQLSGWHDLYISVSAAAATLAGLLFVGLSLHIRIVVAHPDVRSLARVTLTNFFVVLLAAIAVLQPVDPVVVGSWIAVTGLVSMALLARPLWEGLSERDQAIGVWRLAARFGLSVIGVVGLVASGALIALGRTGDGLGLLLPVIVMLLIVSVRNTWDLLVTVAAKVRDDDG